MLGALKLEQLINDVRIIEVGEALTEITMLGLNALVILEVVVVAEIVVLYELVNGQASVTTEVVIIGLNRLCWARKSAVIATRKG